jgi:hypothetical protein
VVHGLLKWLGGGVGGWCVVCIGKLVDNGVVVVCEIQMGDVNYKVQWNMIN